jgi:outer membrane lipoprotein carrier protein
MRQRTTIILLLALAATSPGAAETKALDGPAVLERVQGWLDATRDLQGEFEQTLVSGALGSGLRERGEIYVSRPGRMRFDYLEPEHKVAIVDGDRTSLYLAEDAEMMRGRLEDSGDLLPSLLAGERPLALLFVPELVSVPEPGEPPEYRVRLAPLGESDTFESVVITVKPPEFDIASAEVLDAAGNRMLYRFSDVRRNEGVDPGRFTFEPPPGTTVSGAP